MEDLFDPEHFIHIVNARYAPWTTRLPSGGQSGAGMGLRHAGLRANSHSPLQSALLSLGIADAEDMDDVELDLLKRLHEDAFTPWDDRKTDHLAAIQAGMTNYGPMKGLVRRVLRETARNVDD